MALLRSKTVITSLRCCCRIKPCHVVSRTAFFSRKKEAKEEAESDVAKLTRPRKLVPGVDLTMKERLNLLATKTKLTTKKGYKPPVDADQRIESLTTSLCKVDGDWREVSLHNARLKFKLLTAMIKEFEHDIPNASLNEMKTVGDAAVYFSTEIRDTTTYEDFSKMDLPKNMHIQLEYLRFDPKDKMFGGRTAYPGQDTIVGSIKYKRKYDSIKTKTEKPGYADHYYGY